MKLIALISLLSPLNALAADGANACTAADSHARQRACLISTSEKVEAQLARVEVESLERIDHWDEDANYRARSNKALVNSTAAFRKYRISQCGLMHSLAAGGNGATDMQLECSIELTNQRISQLESSVLRLERR